jgi:thiol-disulfide isomerase/thioredoxin
MALVILVACSSSSSSPPPPPPPASAKLELVDAPAADDVAPVIAKEYTRAAHDGKRLVVYVGAAWCEPCRYFHDAAAAGKLDGKFGNLRLLVFDNDRDGAALLRAGYNSKLIPLFVLPNADGTSSNKQIEGSVKGADAVQQISPRLDALLAG